MRTMMRAAMRDGAHGRLSRRACRTAACLVTAGVVAAGAVAGCGGPQAIGGSPVTTVGSATSATIAVKDLKGFGRVLVTGSGRALYLLTSDPSGGSSCYGSCSQVWPPLVRTGGPVKAGPGVNSHLLATFEDHQHQNQVEYAKHALYTYVDDTGPGMVTGEGVATYGGVWWLVSPSGHAVERGKLK